LTGGLRALLDTERNGVLATLSAGRDGWPFASVAAYALTDAGDPLLVLSDLAEHSRNLRADPRASLLVQDQTSLADPQAGARVTLLGMVEGVAAEEARAIAQAAYVARHPQAADYLAMADFHLYVLRVREARFIGGFGDMGWLTGEPLRTALSAS
jgi:putative heme iron utilization protein